MVQVENMNQGKLSLRLLLVLLPRLLLGSFFDEPVPRTAVRVQQGEALNVGLQTGPGGIPALGCLPPRRQTFLPISPAVQGILGDILRPAFACTENGQNDSEERTNA